MSLEVTIERMSPEDREQVLSIYQECVTSGDMVLESDDPGSMDLVTGRNIVARAMGKVIGWAVVDPVEGASLPKGIASVTVFVHPGFRRMGVGRSLLNRAIDICRSAGICTLLSGIVPRNVPALLMVKKTGFKAIGLLRQAGKVRGEWQDAVLLQLRCA